MSIDTQALIAKIKKQTESFDTVVLKEDEANALVEAMEAAEGRNTVLIEFLTHIKRCLVKNREYAPLSHEEIDTLLGINAAGITVKGE